MLVASALSQTLSKEEGGVSETLSQRGTVSELVNRYSARTFRTSVKS